MVLDVGSEFIKSSLLVYDTNFFELVLNEQSARKSDSIVAFSNDNKRLYSILAKAMVSFAQKIIRFQKSALETRFHLTVRRRRRFAIRGTLSRALRCCWAKANRLSTSVTLPLGDSTI